MKKFNACPASTASNRQAALLELQQLSFSLVDLNLFLDTHPTNQMALDLFRQFQQEFAEAAADYESQFGPLVADDADTTQGWAWVQTPWPWEMED